MSKETFTHKEERKNLNATNEQDRELAIMRIKEAAAVSKQIFALAKKYMELTGDKGFTLKIGNHV